MTWTIVVIALLNGQRSVATWEFSKPYACSSVAATLLKDSRVEAAWCSANVRS